MSKAKHTPGPWATDCKDHEEPYQNIKVKAGKHHTICTVCIDDAPVRDFNEMQEANARLIAAAPDHFAVALELDRLMLVIESAVRWQDPSRSAAVVAMLKANRDAIAKTKGEA